MAEPYREPRELRPRWVITCWPRASAWPFLAALALSVPCAILGWQGNPAAQVLGCSPEAPAAMRCSVTSAEFPTHTRVEDCRNLPEHLAMHSSLTHQIELRPPDGAFAPNVRVNGAPVRVARLPSPKGEAEAFRGSPVEALRECAEGRGGESIEVDIRRRNVWLLLVVPFLALLAAAVWAASRRVRVVFEPGARTALATRGTASGVTTVLDDTARPGWIRLGDVEHEGSLEEAATRARLARWFARRLA